MDYLVLSELLIVINILLVVTVLDIILVISSTDNSALFCNDQSLLSSLDSPTAYCAVSGTVSYVMMLLICCVRCTGGVYSIAVSVLVAV